MVIGYRLLVIDIIVLKSALVNLKFQLQTILCEFFLTLAHYKAENHVLLLSRRSE